jgi:hypothetical protein
MSKKRGQVTIFMVLALFLLLLGSLYFYSKRASLFEGEFVQPEIAPAKNFVEACIVSVARQGLAILGTNGGYITFPEEIELNPRSYLKLGPVSGIKNPYWWYDGVQNIPSEGFITSQLEAYITSELETCIEGFQDFNQFEVEERGPLNVKVTLNEEDTTVDVNYPITLISNFNRTRYELENFRQDIPVRLKKVYEAARDVLEAENRDFFLEFKTIDLIALDSDIPTTGLEPTCAQRIWSVDAVENKLKKLLSVNLPYINVVNSEFDDKIFVPNPFGESTYKDSYYNAHYKWQITDKNYDGLRISFSYDERWPFLFYARPSRDGLLKSNAQTGQDLLDFFCLHIWHFTYDAIYPVKTTIIDNSGVVPFQFTFAFKVSVDHNQPRRENFASTVLEAPDRAMREEYCSDLVNEITVFTIANVTDQFDVAHVNLTYTCGIFTCPIGESEWISFGAAAALTRQFPFCASGILRGNKGGFEQAEMFIGTETPASYTMFLRPVKEYTDYEVVKHDFDNPSAVRSLNEDEKASITVKSKTTGFETFGAYPISGSLPIKLLSENHEYDVTIYLSNNEDIIGGYQGTWSVNPDPSSGKITFHVLEKQGSQNDRFLFISGLNSYSQRIPKPEIR